MKIIHHQRLLCFDTRLGIFLGRGFSFSRRTAIWQYFGDFSIPTIWIPSILAARSVVPDPHKGSRMRVLCGIVTSVRRYFMRAIGFTQGWVLKDPRSFLDAFAQ